ncbi:MAG: DUF3488 and transglutaminase-like domain-containing protein [Syntrophobacter sp.]
MVRIETLLKIATYVCALAGFGAVLGLVHPAYLAGFVLLCILAGLRDFGTVGFPFPPRWFLNIASVLALVPSVYRVDRDNLVEPVLEGLLLLLGIKLLEDKKYRDYMQVCLISIFLLLGSTLISLHSAFALYFFILILFSTVSLILLAFFSRSPNLAVTREIGCKISLQGLLICVLAVPVSVVLFLVFPRADFPLFSFLNKVGGATSGFSDSVMLGDVSEMQEDSSVVFRAAMQSIPEENLYWRGVELDHFDGKSWKRGIGRSALNREEIESEEGTVQTIYLEPHGYGSRYLFALDRPVAIQGDRVGFWKRLDGFWPEHVNERIRYMAVSDPAGFAPASQVDLDEYVMLPSGFSPRIVELVRNTIGEAGDPVNSIMGYLRSGGFSYSLAGLPVSNSPLDDFIFEYRRGNCEYFASALAVMLRAAGVPARLIGGYRGGYYNPAGGYYLVLQKNAHVWVEAYREGGWVRLDPTPISIQNPGVAYRNSLLLNLRLLLDTFDYYWGKFVISYNVSKQVALWRKVRSAVEKPITDLHDTGLWLKAVAVCAGGVLCVFAVVAGVGQLRLSREARLLSRFLRRMRGRGYRKGVGEGLREFTGRMTDPELKAGALEFVHEFEVIFYRDRKFTAADTKRLKSVIRRL